MPVFAVTLTLRYTKINCMPFRASMDFDRVVQARDRSDAVRQSCLCLDRDLEEILSGVNAINVSEVIVEVDTITEVTSATGASLWNPKPFGPQLGVPPHIVVRVDSVALA